jgi:hypothetical protein
MSQKSRTVLFAVVAVASFWRPPTADAFPAFARKYSLACTACHEAWPKLNDFGRAFRDRGYRMGTGLDDPTDKAPAYWPIALRTTPGYSYTSQNNVETDDGLRTLGTGSFEHPEIDILTGGTLSSKASFLAVIAGFGADATAQIESAWVRLDAIGGNPWFNLKVGKHELDQPRSSHRPLSFTQDYLIYVHRPAEDQSLLQFNLADNQLGVELSGHDEGSRTRYSISFADANDAPGNKSILSSPFLYAHVTRRFRPFSSGVLKQARLGAFGTVGWAPTTFATSGGEPIEGSGTNNKTFNRLGGELQLWFGPMSTPLAVTAVVAHANESQDFYGGTHDATWTGGYLQAEFTPRIDLTFFGRYDWIRHSQQPFEDVAKNVGDRDAVTAGMRYTLSYSSRADVAWHVEFTDHRQKAVGPDGLDLTTKQFFTGIDFAF